MPLAPGTRFGSCEVISLLDRGGMGEVYLANDVRLRRQVVLKVMAEHHRLDPDGRARFEREAQALAAINHPNIATIHGVEHADGIQAIVMELVDGQTLADRVRSGLGLSESLAIATQLVDALEAAHERGIVHRDLKPSNIRLTATGTVKVLDFGLAKAFERQADQAATVTATGAGVVGTPGYMSPEQARGQAVDRRTDVWAFGCVFYEMLTSRRAFDGPSSSDVIAAVLDREPDYAALPTDTPPLVRRLLRRCLEKDPKRRLRDIADARIDLEEAPADPSDVAGATSPPRSRLRRSLLFACAAIALVIAGALAARPFLSNGASAVARQFVVLPPKGGTFGTSSLDRTPGVSLSPDGSRLAFVATVGSVQRIWVQPLTSLEPVPISGTEGASSFSPPTWSPDGSSIAFVADGKLKRIGIQGGAAITLADAPTGQGATWNRAGTIVFAPSPNSTLFRVQETGGTAIPITRLAAGDLGHSFPQFLPDGRRFIYFVRAPLPRRGVYVGAVDDPQETFVRTTRERALYAPPGHLLFLDNGRLLAQKFDVDRLAVSGDPMSVAESVAYINTDGRVSADVSPNGTLVYRVSGIRTASQPIFLDRAGRNIGPAGPPGDYGGLTLSPDGTRLAFELHDLHTGTGDIWMHHLARKSTDVFTSDRMHNSSPVWSPDARQIVFTGRPDGGRNLHLKAVDGGGSDEPLLPLGVDRNPLDWSRDGKFVIFEEGPNDGERDLWTLQMPERTPGVFLRTKFSEHSARFSPDGRWVAYLSNETGRFEVRVCRFPDCSGRLTLSTSGGAGVRWHPKGHELFFVDRQNDVYVVPVTTGATFTAGVPRKLFRLDRFVEATFETDGERFLTVPPPPGPEPIAPPMTVIENWRSLLGPGS
jgi:serine/threonine protein kinase